MTIKFNKAFRKQIKNLRPAQKARLQRALVIFQSEPDHPELYNHALKGQWQNHRSIAFGGDWRAHYLPKGKDEALFVAVGTHSQLYK